MKLIFNIEMKNTRTKISDIFQPIVDYLKCNRNEYASCFNSNF